MAKSSESSIVTKCARVMDILTHARKPLVFSEILEATGFVKSSSHRILSVLQNERLVSYDKEKRTYEPGPRFKSWARAGFHRVDLQQAAEAPMGRLCSTTGMNTALSVFDGDSILYLRTEDSFAMRYAGHAGDHAPLHSTAAGKVFLAHMPASSRASLLASLKLEKYTEFTRTTPEGVEADLPVVLENGFAMVVKEEFLQVMGISTPVWSENRKVAACLSLWTLTSDTEPATLRNHSGLLMETANRITEKIGGLAPDPSHDII